MIEKVTGMGLTPGLGRAGAPGFRGAQGSGRCGSRRALAIIVSVALGACLFGATPSLIVTPSSLSLSTSGIVGAISSIDVNSSGAPITFVVSSSGNWLSVIGDTPLGAGSWQAATPTSVAVFVDSTNLKPGAYSGSITVASAGAINSPQIVAVSLAVGPAPTLSANPNSLTMTAPVGSASQARSISVSASDSSLGSFTAAASGGSWLTISPASGFLPATVGVTVNPAGLNVGTYSGSIFLSVIGAANSPLSIPVNLTITPATVTPPPQGTGTLSAGATQIFSQVVDGANWQTTITLLNLGSNVGSFTLSFLGDNGQPLALDTNLGASRAAVSGTIPPHGSLVVSTAGVKSTLSQGWGLLKPASDSLISGSALFRAQADGQPDLEASVPGDISDPTRATMPFDHTDAGTGLALVNQSASAAAIVSILMRDQAGNQLVLDSFTMPALTHQAITLNTRYPQTVGHFGSVEVSTTGLGVNVLGLRYSGATFTSITPINSFP